MLWYAAIHAHLYRAHYAKHDLTHASTCSIKLSVHTTYITDQKQYVNLPPYVEEIISHRSTDGKLLRMSYVHITHQTCNFLDCIVLLSTSSMKWLNTNSSQSNRLVGLQCQASNNHTTQTKPTLWPLVYRPG